MKVQNKITLRWQIISVKIKEANSEEDEVAMKDMLCGLRSNLASSLSLFGVSINSKKELRRHKSGSYFGVLSLIVFWFW